MRGACWVGLGLVVVGAACSPAKVTGGSAASGTSGASASSSASASSGTASSGTSGASSSTTGTTGASGSTGAGGASIDALVGINAFIDDPLDKLAAFGTVREYQDWVWNDGNGQAGYAGYPNNQLQFNLWNGFWDFDHYFSTLAAQGQVAFPAVQGSVDYLGGRMPPVPSGASTTEPASYVAHADFLFQLIARYGATHVDDALLKLASGQTRVSAMGVLRYVEDGNEPDNNWTRPGGAYLFTPAEYAAMASADYDGDQGRLGATVGLKRADPGAQMVLAGLAGAGPGTWIQNVTGYLDGIRAFAQAHRAGSFPADVLNVHTYCFGPDPFGTTNPRPGVAPEDCGLSSRLGELVHYRDQHLPGHEVWVTEFGYDTDPGSNLRAPAIGAASAQVVQGQWLVRSVLAIAEAGIDRATIFVSRDNCSSPTCTGHDTQFSTSGVLTEKGQFTPKVSYFYLSGFRQGLHNMRFSGVDPQSTSALRVDRFRDASGGGAYVLWLPTSVEAVHASFHLAVPGATQAERVELADQQPAGLRSSLAVTSGSVVVDVSETPLIVRVDRMP